MTSRIDWTPVQAVRGYAMLIEGKRIGLYNHVSTVVQGNHLHWGVAYLIISKVEWALIPTEEFANAPYEITYQGETTPESASISRAFLRDRQLMFPDESPFYLGTSTKWEREAPPFPELQMRILALHEWVNKCLESSSSKIN